MKIELKKIAVYERMSQETTAFNALLYIDGKNVGEVRNDGCGGCTDYHNNGEKGSKEAIKNAEIYCKNLPPKKWSVKDKDGKDMPFDYHMHLEAFLDDLLEDHLKEKEEKRLIKKLEKDCLKSICFRKPEDGLGYRSSSWKGHTIKSILMHPKGREIIQNEINKQQALGYTILNKDLLLEFA